MYTYRRFKTSKWSLSIILIAVALVAWGVLGLTGTPLAKRELATFKLEYSDDSDVAFVGGEQVVDGAVEVDMYMPGCGSINVQWQVVLGLPDSEDFPELEVLEPTYWQILERKKTPGTVLVQYAFRGQHKDGSIVEYGIQMPGTIEGEGELLPAPGEPTTVSSSAEAELSVTKGKYKNGYSWTGYLDWTLTITRK